VAAEADVVDLEVAEAVIEEEEASVEAGEGTEVDVGDSEAVEAVGVVPTGAETEIGPGRIN
jgi:hypothetical protein